MTTERLDAILDRLDALLEEIDDANRRKEIREIQQLVIGVRADREADSEAATGGGERGPADEG